MYNRQSNKSKNIRGIKSLNKFLNTEEQIFGHTDQVSVDQLTLAAEIGDGIYENSSDEIISINEIELLLMKTEQLRTR